MLEIKDLHASVGDKPILKGITLSIKKGEVHAIMGPNGSGKSTLAYTLSGHPKYVVTDGDILFKGKSILELSADERARAGLFLAFQYPVSVPGVEVWAPAANGSAASDSRITDRSIPNPTAGFGSESARVSRDDSVGRMPGGDDANRTRRRCAEGHRGCRCERWRRPVDGSRGRAFGSQCLGRRLGERVVVSAMIYGPRMCSAPFISAVRILS